MVSDVLCTKGVKVVAAYSAGRHQASECAAHFAVALA